MREAVAVGVTAGLPTAACLAVGGAHPLAHVALAAGAFAAVALVAVDRSRADRPLRTSWICAPLLLGLVATLMALVPLPHGLRALLDEDGADRVTRVAALLGPDELQFLRPVLAYDPPEAALAGLRLLVATVAFVVLAHGAGRAQLRRLAYRVLCCGAALVFVVALLHGLVEKTGQTAWGLLPSGASFFHAPLVNANHLGKVFVFFALLGFGRALSIRRGRESGAFFVCGVLCVFGVYWTESRGSLVALACGVALLLMLLLARRVPAELGDARALAIAGIATGLLVATILACTVGADALAQLADLDPEGAIKSKVRVLPWGWLVAREHPVVGTAPGGFALVLPAAIPLEQAFGSPQTGAALDASRFRYTHVENLVLQTVVDHGLIVGGVMLVAVVAVAWHVARSGAAIGSPGAAAALGATLVGELVDFVTEIPAGLLLVVAALALLAGKARPRLAGPDITPSSLIAFAAVAAAFAVLLAFVGMLDWRRSVATNLAGAPIGERRPALLRALARHPSDAQLAYALAVDARTRRDPRGALRFANQALSVSPQHRGAHVEAARALVALGNLSQSLVEYRAAWRSGMPEPSLLDEVLARYPAYVQRRAAFPDEPTALTHLCQKLRTLGASAQSDAQRCFDEVALLPDPSREERAMQIHYAIERGDIDGALARMDLNLAHAPADAAAATALGLERRDGAAAALARTGKWTFARGGAPFYAWRARAALSAKRDDIVDQTLADLDASATDTASFLAAKRIKADVHERRGELDDALELVTMLAARAPGDIDAWVWKARLEKKLGLTLQAQETMRRAERAWPNDPRVQALVAELQR